MATRAMARWRMSSGDRGLIVVAIGRIWFGQRIAQAAGNVASSALEAAALDRAPQFRHRGNRRVIADGCGLRYRVRRDGDDAGMPPERRFHHRLLARSELRPTCSTTLATGSTTRGPTVLMVFRSASSPGPGTRVTLVGDPPPSLWLILSSLAGAREAVDGVEELAAFFGGDVLVA
jgi:hypothetical protein